MALEVLENKEDKMFPLRTHTDFSLLTSTLDCDKLAKTCKELEYDVCAITDYGTVSGYYEFALACKDKGIRPLFGIDAFVCDLPSSVTDDTNRKLSHVTFLCKNKDGCKNMFRAVSESNRNFHDRPRLSLDEWAKFSGEWLVFSGHFGSTLFSSVYKDGRILDNALQKAKESIRNHQDLFGKDNFYVSISLNDKDKFPITEVADILRVAAKKMGVKCVAVMDCHYPNSEDSSDQRILICSSLKTTLSKACGSLHRDWANDINMFRFFESDDYYIWPKDTMKNSFRKEELENLNEVISKCEPIDLNREPQTPIFDPNINAYNEIVDRARKGWSELLNWPKGSKEYEEYGARIKYELEVIRDANLANYFLIVADICRYAKSIGALSPLGRGSGAGCLISYLLGITQVDPIEHGLLFERFFNPSRKNALPDIDLDFQSSKREPIIDYMKNKYGNDCVIKIATFGRMQGRGILKEVLKIHEVSDFKTINMMTEFIPDESKISGELQEMSEENEENAKILYWAVLNNAKQLSPWVRLENGEYEGEFGKYFAQAIRLEGIYRNISEHASGVIVAPNKVDEYCPLVYSGKKLLGGMPFPHLEGMGLCKIDILGVFAYEKLGMIINAMETGDIYVGDFFENESSNITEEIIVNDD